MSWDWGTTIATLMASVVLGFVIGNLLSPCMSMCYVSPECVRMTWTLVFVTSLVIFFGIYLLYDTIWGSESRAEEAKKPMGVLTKALRKT